jgi:hypothetical protein
MKHTKHVVATLLLATLTPLAIAQGKPEGFSCCNLRYESGGDWISDINYFHPNLIALGAVAKVTDYGRYRVAVTLDGKPMRLGNDYSRNLSNEDFAAKWIVKDDPKKKLATYSRDIQEAIKAMKVRKGMTKEQVIMSLGHPVTSENPDPNAGIWRYWLSSFDEFQVVWDASGRIKDIQGNPLTLNRVEHK